MGENGPAFEIEAWKKHAKFYGVNGSTLRLNILEKWESEFSGSCTPTQPPSPHCFAIAAWTFKGRGITAGSPYNSARRIAAPFSGAGTLIALLYADAVERLDVVLILHLLFFLLLAHSFSLRSHEFEYLGPSRQKPMRSLLHTAPQNNRL